MKFITSTVTMLWMLLCTSTSFGQNGTTKGEKRYQDFRDLVLLLDNRNDQEALRLLLAYANLHDPQGQYDMLATVSSVGFSPGTTRIIFDYLLDSRHSDIVIESLKVLAMDHHDICEDAERQKLKALAKSHNREEAQAAQEAVKVTEAYRIWVSSHPVEKGK